MAFNNSVGASGSDSGNNGNNGWFVVIIVVATLIATTIISTVGILNLPPPLSPIGVDAVSRTLSDELITLYRLVFNFSLSSSVNGKFLVCQGTCVRLEEISELCWKRAILLNWSMK